MESEESEIIFEFDNETFTVDPNKDYPYFGWFKTSGFTPLMYLIIQVQNINCDKLNEYILTNMHELNKGNDLFHTPLMLACMNNKEEIVKLLIIAGCDLNLKDFQGNSALSLLASCCNYPNIIKILIDAGCDLNSQNQYGETCIMLACKCNLRELNPMLNCMYDPTIFDKTKDVIKMLINAKCNFKIRNTCTKLFHMKCRGNKSGFEYICNIDKETIKHCFDEHIYYTETDLIKFLDADTKYFDFLIKLLAELLFNKVAYFKAYQKIDY